MRRYVFAFVLLTIAAGLAATPASAGEGRRVKSKFSQAEIEAARTREQARTDEERRRRQALGEQAETETPQKAVSDPRARKIDASAPARPTFKAPAGGTIVGTARSLTCTADAEGVRFRPSTQNPEDGSCGLGYTLTAVCAGGVKLFERQVEAPGAAPELESANTVLYRHGAGVEERYQIRPDGFEQTFVLRDRGGLPEGADLTVEGALDTQLTPSLSKRSSDHSPIEFCDGTRPVISYGAATAIDSEGRKLALETTVDKGVLRIVVDAAWLAEAVFPVTVDPLIGTLLFVSMATSDEGHCDVAYSEASDVYLLVWELEFTPDDHDIYMAVYRGDGTSLSGAFALDDTTDDSLRPSVAWSPNGDVFLVVWEDDVYSVLGGINGAYDLVGAVVDLHAGTATFVDIYSSLSTHGLARVGANHSPGGGFIVAWTLDYLHLGIDYDSAAILVTPQGQAGRLIDITTASVDSYDATVNKVGSGGTPWLVCWSDDRAVAGDLDVWARTVDANGALGPIFDVAYSTEDEFGPSPAGAGGEWCVGYVVDLGVNPTTQVSDWDVCAQRTDGTAKIGALHLAAFGLEPEFHPVVARYDGGSGGAAEYLIAYVRHAPGANAVHADRVTTTLGMIADDVILGSSAWLEQRPTAAARSGVTPAEYLVAWEREVGDWDIRAARIGDVPPVAGFSATPTT
ncbi:hypothetical protein ACFL59_05555, partial [Planctomycetota bacterium]